MFGLFGKSDEYVEQVVCNENDIGENEMKNFDLGDSKVLIVKQNGKISAVGAKCSHYGALLSTGALGEGRVRCPWHGACFNLSNGDIEDFPGPDPIPCYEVKIDQGQVRVRAKKSELQTNKRTHVMAKRQENDYRTYIVVGGGPSAAVCAENLRARGFTGRIVLVSNESLLPYDRPKLSKAMDAKRDAVQLRTQQFYDDNSIEVLLNTAASSLDTENKEVTLSNGYKIKYEKIYIATGSSARKLKIPGSDLKNIFVLRSLEDAHSIDAQLGEETHVAILGDSFIGMEAAAYCSKKVEKVTVIGRGAYPMKAFGREIGQRLMEYFEEKEIEFVMNNGIKECIGNDDGTLKAVKLNDGSELKAEVLIMGVGTTFNTEFLKGSGIAINSNGSIDTNQYLETNIPDVYVGGDIANAPMLNTDNRETIGHYGLAQYYGKVAAMNMCGMKQELKTVPYFWTMLFGKSIRYAGYGRASEVKIEGDMEEMQFVVFYMNSEGRVIAMASCGRDPIVSQFAEYTAKGKVLTKADIESDPFGWTKKIHE